MAYTRTMAQLLQAPTEGYEDAILIPEIVAQNKQFFGHDKEDPHAHIRYFNKITSTIRKFCIVLLQIRKFCIVGRDRGCLELLKLFEKAVLSEMRYWYDVGSGLKDSE
ncbi:hypothetical protein Tco_1535492, partial [Tanacetum coccineum]